MGTVDSIAKASPKICETQTDLPPTTFASLDDVTATLEQALAASPADETEFVWLEQQRGAATTEGVNSHGPPRLSVLIRVVEGRRLGWYRTDATDANELEDGIRLALALAKVQPQLTRHSLFLNNAAESEVVLSRSVPLRDEAIEALDPDQAHDYLARWCHNGMHGTLRWSASRMAIFNSHGLRRSAAATDVSLDVAVGRAHGRGLAGASARQLTTLNPEAVVARAQALANDAALGEVPERPTNVLLAPEATIALLDVLNSHAFAGRCYLRGTSFLTKHRNVQVFDRDFALRDDGTSPDGLAYPFDLEGAPKRPLDLIVEGKPLTPALDRYQGREAELPATSQAVGGGDSLFGHLFLQPREADDDQLLAATDDGLRIGWLEKPACLDPSNLYVRARARGVRRVRNGKLCEPLPDLVWEDSLLRVWAQLSAVGRNVVVRTMPTTPFGAVSAPALVLPSVEGLTPYKGTH